MKLIFSQDCWTLDELHPIEWGFLSQLPGIAGGDGASETALRRLKPGPLADGSTGDSGELDELRNDWDELVNPELDSGFSAAREQVAKDLARAIDSESSGPSITRIEIPDEHTEAWYSTLNQARLLLNETHDIAENTARFYRDELTLEKDAGQLILLAQYEFYTAIQSDLVENRMQP